MKRRVEIKNSERLKEYLHESDRSPDCKALVLLLIQQTSVQQVAELTGIPISTLYFWIHQWNQTGSLSNRRGQGGGPKPRLSPEDQKRLKERLEQEAFWTLQEVRDLLEREFGVTYSETHLRRLLRKLGMKCVKPYPMDYRRPERAEEIVQQSLQTALKALAETGVKSEEIAIGFLDETSPQNTANTVRVWSFDRPRIQKNSSRFRVNAAGFYALKGNDVLGFMERSRSEDICEVLREIRKANAKARVIVVFLDNFPSHRSRAVRAEAEQLGIRLVYFPPYSPDLNPIEQIWRMIRRELSSLLVKNVDELRQVIRSQFERLVQQLSFCRAWITRFFNPCWNALFSNS